MRRSLLTCFLGAALVFGTAGSCLPGSETPAVEVEDCDAEDYRNRESDCGFSDSDRRKTPAVRKPAPRNTRR